jgi:hypothetical protein
MSTDKKPTIPAVKSANFDETDPLIGNTPKKKRNPCTTKVDGSYICGAVITASVIAGIVCAVVFTRKNTGNPDNPHTYTASYTNNSPYTLKFTAKTGDGANCTCVDLKPGETQQVELQTASSWSDIEYDVYDNNGNYTGHVGIRTLPNAVQISNENTVFVTTGAAQSNQPQDVHIVRANVRPGLNQAGFEFGNNPNQINPPKPVDVNSANANSFSSLRMPFKLEYASDATYVQKYVTEVEYALSQNNQVIVEPHNYMLFNGQPITPAQCKALIGDAFINLFKTLSSKYPGKLIVEAMNEPTDAVTPQQLVDCYAPLIKEARANGHTGTIVIEGNTWATPHVLTNPDGTASDQFNTLLPLLTDKATYGDVELGIHCYFDGANGGGPGTGECIDNPMQTNRIPQLTALAKQHDIKIRVTETGVINTPNCLGVLDEFMGHINTNSDVYQSYNAWVATPVSTPAWSPLLLDLDPSGKTTPDPRIKDMQKYINTGTANNFFQPAPVARIAGNSSSNSNNNAAGAIGLAMIPAVGGVILLLVFAYVLYRKFYSNAETQMPDIEKGLEAPKSPRK